MPMAIPRRPATTPTIGTASLHHRERLLSEDAPDAASRIEDTDRVMYLRNPLTHLRRAAQDGYPVKGYLASNAIA
jgi:hypothetical protein